MNIVAEHLNGVKIYRPFVFEDERGGFVKSYHEKQLQELGIHFDMKEEFFSSSCKGVLRGMHFQVPPAAHQKLIYCIAGKVRDVLLDLRKDSPSYGDSVSFILSAENRHIVYVPIGFAHEFYSMEENSCLLYKTDRVHSIEHDKGLLWNSFGHDWAVSDSEIILSQRDQDHPEFDTFKSPF